MSCNASDGRGTLEEFNVTGFEDIRQRVDDREYNTLDGGGFGCVTVAAIWDGVCVRVRVPVWV